MTSKPLLVEEAIIGELVETNQLLTNVIKLIDLQQSRLIKLSQLSFHRTQHYPQDSDLMIYSPCRMLFLYRHVQIARLETFMQIKCRDSKFKHSLYASPQIDGTKDNCSRGK